MVSLNLIALICRRWKVGHCRCRRTRDNCQIIEQGIGKFRSSCFLACQVSCMYQFFIFVLIKKVPKAKAEKFSTHAEAIKHLQNVSNAISQIETFKKSLERLQRLVNNLPQLDIPDDNSTNEKSPKTPKHPKTPKSAKSPKLSDSMGVYKNQSKKVKKSKKKNVVH